MLRFGYCDLVHALHGIDFATLRPVDLAPFGWDFRSFVASLLSDEGQPNAETKKFISSLDFCLVLRLIAERSINRDLKLQWRHEDLLKCGWSTFEDLTEIDRPVWIVNYTLLYGQRPFWAKTPASVAIG